ncbi:MAG: ParB/RepB/Spo0J family partition protein [Clostridia bacterium]|nr:ParB/RepB/Spo0J family partition protein [Clostridia bacterium]
MSEGGAGEEYPLSGGQIEEIEAARIEPNPAQPRREFDTEALLALSESIRRHGILQPPVVRRLPGGEKYELIAGERRLRAARMAGLEILPCLVRESSADESAELAIIENLQRRDLDIFEEASAIAALCDRFRMTQEQVAARLAVSQSYVANKLRLLRLSQGARGVIAAAGLTERHARAVLRLPEERREPALRHMADEGMNVAAAEKYVERLLEEKRPRARHAGVIKDIRLFYNSLDRAMRLVREAGIDIAAERRENEGEIELTIRIQKPSGARIKRPQTKDEVG